MTNTSTSKRYFTVNGKPTFLLGVNYWSRAGGPRMWDRFDAAKVKAELAQMKRIGLNTSRSFAFIPSFMPKPGVINPEATAQMAEFFRLCETEGVYTIPSFLVGHMSGENYDFVNQHGRSTYTDPEVMAWQAQMVQAVAEAAVKSPAVIAYLASNEMPLWGGHTSSPQTIKQWAQHLRTTLRKIDDKRPFSLGDGAMNLKGGQNGFDAATLRHEVDFLGPHTYHADTDDIRQSLNAEYCIRSLSHWGLPVLFEEFGCSSAQVSEENQAHYYREVIHTCLSTGSAGALGWCFSDFDLVDDPPYNHHAFELTFGITRADGSDKPVCQDLRQIADLTEKIDFSTFVPPKITTAILVPSYFHTTYPFSWEERSRMRKTLLQAYTMCVMAGLEAELIPEDADLSRYQLIMAPATQKLLAPTWRNLVAQANAGKTIYWSYFGSDYNFHQGAWIHNFSELTGCTHQLRYGCADMPPDHLQLVTQQAQLTFQSRTDVGNPYPRAYLPITPIASAKTEIVAKTSNGIPALTRCKLGAGQVFFGAFPFEYYLAEQHHINEQSPSDGLYRYLGQQAQVIGEISGDSPFVQVRTAIVNGKTWLWLINHAWQPSALTVKSPAGKTIYGNGAALKSGSTALTLDPKQVLVYELT